MKHILLTLFILYSVSAISQTNTQKIDTTESNRNFLIGKELVDNGSIEDAKAYLIKSLEFNPSHDQAEVYLAYCYYFLLEFDNAIE